MMTHNRNTTGSSQDALRQDPILSDNSTSEEEPDLTLTITEEEHRGTIPGSNKAAVMALAGQRAIANPVVEQSKPRKVKKIPSSTPKGHTSTQTEPQTPVTK